MGLKQLLLHLDRNSFAHVRRKWVGRYVPKFHGDKPEAALTPWSMHCPLPGFFGKPHVLVGGSSSARRLLKTVSPTGTNRTSK